MLKRVDIARTYAVDPAIMLMDEPFGPLDAQTRSIMQEELARMWFEARKTVIFVTHDVDEAIFLADRVVIFTPRPGRIKTILEVNLPRPRVKKIILSKEFLKLKEKALLELGFI